MVDTASGSSNASRIEAMSALSVVHTFAFDSGPWFAFCREGNAGRRLPLHSLNFLGAEHSTRVGDTTLLWPLVECIFADFYSRVMERFLPQR